MQANPHCLFFYGADLIMRESLRGVGLGSDQGGSDNVLPFQNPYPGKLRVGV